MIPSCLIHHFNLVNFGLANRAVRLPVGLRTRVAHHHMSAIEKYNVPVVRVADNALLTIFHFLQLKQPFPYQPFLSNADVDPSLDVLQQQAPRYQCPREQQEQQEVLT